jgi:hypothetical protein
MRDHRDDLIAAITWRVGQVRAALKSTIYTVGNGAILSEVERPEEVENDLFQVSGGRLNRSEISGALLG